jgi:truncated hemoglobin YjbI
MSRFITVFPERKERGEFFMRKLRPEERAAREKLLDRIYKLSTMFGELSVTPEAKEFMSDWWKSEAPKDELGAHPRYRQYLGRRRVMVQKVAMASHFSNSDDMTLVLEDFQNALTLLEPIEAQMAEGFKNYGVNPEGKLIDRIVTDLKEMGPRGSTELYENFKGDMGIMEFRELLGTMASSGILALKQGAYEVIGRKAQI